MKVKCTDCEHEGDYEQEFLKTELATCDACGVFLPSRSQLFYSPVITTWDLEFHDLITNIEIRFNIDFDFDESDEIEYMTIEELTKLVDSKLSYRIKHEKLLKLVEKEIKNTLSISPKGFESDVMISEILENCLGK